MNNFDYQQQQDVRPLLLFLFGPAESLESVSVSAVCPPPSKYLINLDIVAFDGVEFVLRSPIELELYQADGLWNCESKKYEILAAGVTPERAVHSFSEDFLASWDEIAQSPDKDLSEEAQELKHRFLDVVKSVKKRR